MHELPSSTPQDDIDMLIDRWVMTKYQKSNSVRTRDCYLMTIKRFRTFLQEHECDITADVVVLLPLLEEWIGATHRPGLKMISPATRNLRAAILSSFYRFALLHGVLDRNPLDRIERGTPAEPRRARPLDDHVVERKLGAIDRTTPLGLRDYALIVIAVTTGRRAGEIAAMRLGHLTPTEQGILVRWPRLKGARPRKHSWTIRSRMLCSRIWWSKMVPNGTRCRMLIPFGGCRVIMDRVTPWGIKAFKRSITSILG